ncbi:MAG: TrbC/VirB2 family protein [candidate division KSB1 bacterium]|jgi:heme A synthase|nr:TrbC/VirB2 family protein [candidate division KSB1 bacterium]MDZ7340256.1 TrbC/VirB2 family protein [candidate division KSB1 bacterium]
MQTITGALKNIIDVLVYMASFILVLALIVAGFNMASADGGRQEKAKKQLIGIAIAAIIIYGAKFIIPALISLVPGASASF